MDDVEVEVVDPEAPEAPLGFPRWIVAAGIELRGEEQVLAGNVAVSDRLADALLVAIRLRRVDVAVAELERPTDGVDALGSVRHLPHAETEHRHLVAVGQDGHVSIRCHAAMLAASDVRAGSGARRAASKTAVTRRRSSACTSAPTRT